LLVFALAALVLSAILGVGAVVAGFHNAVARAVLGSVGHGLGYDISTRNFDINLGEVIADGVRISTTAGEPVFAARRIDIAYSLRDLLPGGTRLFGLKSVSIDAPHITLIHHSDGTYNISVPPSSQPNAKSPSGVLDLRLHVGGGSVDLIDRFSAAPRERRERIVDIAADGALSQSAPSTYRAGAVLVDAGQRYPLVGTGRFADARGFELQHFTAGRLPIAALADFVLPTRAIVVQGGEIENLDVKLGALATSAGTLQSHLGLTGRLADGRLASSALAKPVRDARASLLVDDDSATVARLDAAINGVALRGRGAVYHFAAPRVTFALTVRGDLARVRGISKDIARLPIGGAIAAEALVEGRAADPLVFARFRSPHVNYGVYRLDGPRGFAAVSGHELDLLSAAVRYGTVDVAARAALQLQRHTQTAGYAQFRVPANGLPYVDRLLPGTALAGSAVVRGSDGNLGARGYLGGAGAGDRLDVPFSFAPTGSGTIGPVALQRRDGAAVYARVAVDRAARQTVAIVDARALSLLPAPTVRLPGLRLPVLPPKLDAKLDATVAGSAIGTSLTAASGELHAYGTWGDLRADAGGSGTQLAARGRLTSSFDRLAALGANIAARGGIDVPFRLTTSTHAAPNATILQIADARFPGAVIRGVPLSRADATLGIGSRSIDVYSADLRIAGRDITARGSFGNGGFLHLTAGDVDLAALRSTGVPWIDGRATVLADVGGTSGRPVATVLAALAGAHYAGSAVGGNAGLAYDGAALHVDRASVTVAGAYADATGTIAGLTLGHIAPRYDLRATLEDADIATLAHSVKTALPYPAGTLDADVRVGGSGGAPSVVGEIRIPEGSINGLYFRAGRVGFTGSPTALRASGGQVVVGGTTLDFAGSASRTQQSGRLASRALNLADFNDYFDAADVLAGTGRLALAFDAAPRHLTTSADIGLSGVRYRRFVLGDMTATAGTVGTAVRLHGSVAGTNGRAVFAGTVNVPVTDPLRDIARRAYVDLSGQIAGINLGNVLPAANVSAPVLGIVDATAVVRGRYPVLALSTHATLSNGVVGRFPIERFSLAATAANGRGRLTDLTLAAPGLSASASGTFGLRPSDRFDLSAQVTSAAIDTLVTAATGKNPGIKGTLGVHAQLSGTIGQPHLASSIDLGNLAYGTVVVPHVHTDVAASRQLLDVRNGTIALMRGGTIAFDGQMPLSARAETPIAFDFAPHGVNVDAYSALLPDGSVAQGIFDGNLSVRGTLGAPQLNGSLTFANGSYRSNTLKLPLTAIALQLDFAGTSVRIAKLHAHAAPGNFDGSGSLTLGDLRDPLPGLRANIRVTANNALVSAPKYYVGFVDGTISATKSVRAPLVVGGQLDFSSARIPYTALLPSGGTSPAAAPALPNVDFNLDVKAGRDVRVQSGPVDIGTTGSAHLAGTLAKPTLSGQFTATDGTVSLYRTFVVQNGSSVSFSPADGITPSVDATAVTNIPDPATDVLLHITGLSTHLRLAFSSQPAYSQQQILGLLVGAQALGAVSGVAQTSGSSSSGASIAGIGEGVLNTQLTQKFLQPFTSKLGGALGLSDLNLNYNTNGAVSAVARRTIGKNVSFSYGEQIGGPTPQTTLGINVGTAISGAQLTLYEAAGSQEAFGGQALTPFLQSGFLATTPPNYTLQAIAPPTGSGFVFSYQRHFW
jgi:autotransporter translocation and assembly factor TamB